MLIIINKKSICEKILNCFRGYTTSTIQPNDLERQLAEQKHENAILRNINAELQPPRQHNLEQVFVECVAMTIPQASIAQCVKMDNSTEYFENDFPLASASPVPINKR